MDFQVQEVFRIQIDINRGKKKNCPYFSETATVIEQEGTLKESR